MTNKRIVAFLIAAVSLTVSILFIVSCSGDSPSGPQEQQKQLELLAGRWKIESATRFIDRTAEFKDPDFTLTITGEFDRSNPDGPYNYITSGTVPDPCPWAVSGNWTFGNDPTTTLVRDDGVEMSYILNGSTLTLTFTCVTCDEDNGRVLSTDGEWVFVFTAN